MAVALDTASAFPLTAKHNVADGNFNTIAISGVTTSANAKVVVVISAFGTNQAHMFQGGLTISAVTGLTWSTDETQGPTSGTNANDYGVWIWEGYSSSGLSSQTITITYNGAAGTGTALLGVYSFTGASSAVGNHEGAFDNVGTNIAIASTLTLSAGSMAVCGSYAGNQNAAPTALANSTMDISTTEAGAGFGSYGLFHLTAPTAGGSITFGENTPSSEPTSVRAGVEILAAASVTPQDFEQHTRGGGWARPFIDRAAAIRPSSPNNLVVIVPKAPIPPALPERWAFPLDIRWMDRTVTVRTPGPASQVVIVPKSPVPPVAPERFPYPPWTDRSLRITPPGNQSDLRNFGTSWTPTLPERFPYPPWTDRSAVRLPPGTAAQLVVVPKDPIAPTLPERYPYPAWTDYSASSKPAGAPPAASAPTWGYEAKGLERAPQPPQAERSATVFPVGPQSQVGTFGIAWSPALPERTPQPVWLDRSAVLTPPLVQLVGVISGVQAIYVHAYLIADGEAGPPIQIAAPIPWGYESKGLERHFYPPWTNRNAVVGPIGPASLIVIDPKAGAWQSRLPERFPYPPWLDRSLTAIAPRQLPAPLLSWTPSLPHRLLVALRAPPSIDYWLSLFPFPVFLVFGPAMFGQQDQTVMTGRQDATGITGQQDAGDVKGTVS